MLTDTARRDKPAFGKAAQRRIGSLMTAVHWQGRRRSTRIWSYGFPRLSAILFIGRVCRSNKLSDLPAYHSEYVGRFCFEYACFHCGPPNRPGFV